MNPTQLAALIAGLPEGTTVKIELSFVTPYSSIAPLVTTSSGTTVPLPSFL